MPEIAVSVPRDQTAEEWGTAPSCFHIQLLSFPGVMYFISLAILPSADNSLMSVRRPGIVLDSESTELVPRGEKKLTQTASRLPEPQGMSLEYRTRGRRIRRRRRR